MRCPKCGYITFDVLESCTKCGKNISTTSQELGGTVASIAPPPFLKFDLRDTESQPGEAVSEFETEETFDLGGEEEEVFVDLGTTEEGSTVEAETGEMEITAEEPGAEAAVEEPAEEESEEPIGISDLAPSEETTEEIVEEVGEKIGEEPSEEFEMAEVSEQPESEQAGQGLADLKVEGIDLDSSPAPVGKGKVMPSVKTGTALDDFDVDLGDLLPKK